MNVSELNLPSILNGGDSKSQINLIEKLTEEQEKAMEFVDNYNSESYKKYLALLENYFNEKKSKKYNQKYKYFVDEESRFVKEAFDKSDDKNNSVINVPKYINIDLKLRQLKTLISTKETKLRFIRSSLLNGSNSQADEFDKVKNELISHLKDRNILIEAKKIIDRGDNSVNVSQEEIDEILNKKIQQNNNYVTISELIENKQINDDLKNLIKKYIQNNIEIIKYQERLRTLKSQLPPENIVEELPTNEKKKIKFKPKSKTKGKSKKVAGERLEDAVPEVVQIPELSGYKDIESYTTTDTDIPEVDSEVKNIQINSSLKEGNEETSDDEDIINKENSTVNLLEDIGTNKIPETEKLNLINNINEQNQSSNLDELDENEIDIFSNIDNSLILKQNNGNNDDSVDLLPGEDLEISEMPDLSGELEDLSDFDNERYENEVKFNSPESIKNKTEELNYDKQLPLFNENNQENQNTTEFENTTTNTQNSKDESIDINKLSRDLNKKVPDNIKLISINIDPNDNINFSGLKRPIKNKK